jgi:protein SCO1/2
MELIDQHGRNVTLESFRGRPVLVAFAYAHCETVCPVIVTDVVTAAARLRDTRPAVLIVTLDPWRDTPSRLAAIAAAWRLHDDASVLSGPPDTVNRVLNAWRIPRTRNERTGEISHPSLVYIIGVDGRIAYVVTGDVDTIAAAVRAL